MSPGNDNPDKEDVYSAKTYAGTGPRNLLVEHCSVRVAAENSPLALSRIYGLLATLAIVPSISRSTIVNVNELAVELEFCDVPFSSIDRLCRKLTQTTEIIAVSTLPADIC